MNTSGPRPAQHGVAETERPGARGDLWETTVDTAAGLRVEQPRIITIELCAPMSARVRRCAAIGGSSVEKAVMAALRSYFGNPCSEGNTR